jgi:short-subunit dehydrogenase
MPLNDPVSNPTALITGASSGIGQAFAYKLASQGYNLLLIARRSERLSAIAMDLTQKFKVHSEALSLDLSQSADIENLAEKIRTLPALHLLINNAGFGIQGPFVHNAPEREKAMIQLHVLAPSQLSLAALPLMMRQRSGSIVNVASVAGLMLTPDHVNYNATKAYLISFSKSLAEEYQHSGIQIQALCPGYTRTAFHQQADFLAFQAHQVPSFLWMEPEHVVEKSLAALKSGQVIVIPGVLNQLMTFVFTQPLLRHIILPIYRRITH